MLAKALLPLLCLLVNHVDGSHFRYGTISWVPLGGNKARFFIQSAWKRDYWDGAGYGIDGDGLIVGPSEDYSGDTFEVPDGQHGNKWYFGDSKVDPRYPPREVEAGRTEPIYFKNLVVKVTAPADKNDFNYLQNQALGISTQIYQFNSPTAGDGEMWTAGFYGCCRLGAKKDGDPIGTWPDGLNNNGFKDWNVQTFVDLSDGPTGQNRSPVAVGAPILRIRWDTIEEFDIVAVDDDDDDLTWRLGAGEEMGDAENKQPGHGNNLRRADGEEEATPMNQPQPWNEQSNMMKIDTKELTTSTGDNVRVGIATWNTDLLREGYWQSTIMIMEARAVIPYDFLLLVKNPKGNTPPVWAGETPRTIDTIVRYCSRPLSYAMFAEDEQAGNGIRIFRINVAPVGMQHSGVSGVSGSANPNNPVQQNITWTPDCSHQTGKFVQCYQADDDGDGEKPEQPLSSRVRCVVIRVKHLQNDAPTICDETLAMTQVQACVGEASLFGVCVQDLIDNDPDCQQTGDCPGAQQSLDISFVEYPTGSTVSGIERFQEGSMAVATAQLSYTPAAVESSDFCFSATDSHPLIPKSTDVHCMNIDVRVAPVVNSAPTEVLDAFVDEPLVFEIVASDGNSGDTISFARSSDDGIPGDVTLEIGHYEDSDGEGDKFAAGALPGQEAIARYTFTADAKYMGNRYTECLRISDDGNDCGGGVEQCVTVRVVSPMPTFIEPTPGFPGADGPVDIDAYVGCNADFTVKAGDPNNFPTIASFDEATELPEGCSVTKVAADQYDVTWRPSRGQEAATYNLCFTSSDEQQSVFVEQCFHLHVKKCFVCSQEGDSLLSISDEYGTHWTQLYSSNQNIKYNPDKLAAGTILSLGPIYKAIGGDTLLSIAARYGVSVNALLAWNPDVLAASDPSENENNHSRLISVDDHICILPKTCFNTYEDQQRSFFSSGSWADPDQTK